MEETKLKDDVSMLWTLNWKVRLVDAVAHPLHVTAGQNETALNEIRGSLQATTFDSACQTDKQLRECVLPNMCESNV